MRIGTTLCVNARSSGALYVVKSTICAGLYVSMPSSENNAPIHCRNFLYGKIVMCWTECKELMNPGGHVLNLPAFGTVLELVTSVSPT